MYKHGLLFLLVTSGEVTRTFRVDHVQGHEDEIAGHGQVLGLRVRKMLPSKVLKRLKLTVTRQTKAQVLYHSS